MGGLLGNSNGQRWSGASGTVAILGRATRSRAEREMARPEHWGTAQTRGGPPGSGPAPHRPPPQSGEARRCPPAGPPACRVKPAAGARSPRLLPRHTSWPPLLPSPARGARAPPRARPALPGASPRRDPLIRAKEPPVARASGLCVRAPGRRSGERAACRAPAASALRPWRPLPGAERPPPPPWPFPGPHRAPAAVPVPEDWEDGAEPLA